MKTDIEYWQAGTRVIEAALAAALLADPSDVPSSERLRVMK